jgi:hypothetical protein
MYMTAITKNETSIKYYFTSSPYISSYQALSSRYYSTSSPPISSLGPVSSSEPIELT